MEVSLDYEKDVRIDMSDLPSNLIGLVRNFFRQYKKEEKVFINTPCFLEDKNKHETILKTYENMMKQLKTEYLEEGGSFSYFSEYQINDLLNYQGFSKVDINNSAKKYDCLFSYFPFGTRSTDERYQYLYQNNQDSILPLHPRNSIDYYIFNQLLKHLKADGFGISLISGRSLYNQVDKELREFMIKKGLIEGVVELPDKLFADTYIKTYLVMFSFGNRKIKFANLSEAAYQVGRNRQVLKEEEAFSIFYENSNNKNVILVSNEDVLKRDVNLLPAFHLMKNLKINLKTKPLGEISHIFTGWQVSSQKLDAIYQVTITDVPSRGIIQMSDIEDGQIKTYNHYRVEDKQYEMFGLREDDVLITTKSIKVKVAVVKKHHHQILASGNIMVIRVNKDLIDPYYLAAYLESNIGREQLALKQIGDVIKNLTINNVKTLDIPMLDLTEQVKIGEAYSQNNQSIQMFKKKIDKTLKDKENLFDFMKMDV